MRGLVGLVGRKGSGKTTAARFLVERCGYARVPFAAPLKAMLAAIGLTNEQLNGDQKETPSDLLCGHTPRHAMQTLGTNWAREMIHPEVWLRLWREQAKKHPLVVVDDVRFPNEADLIHSMGGVLIKIVRPNDNTEDGHASEAQIDALQCDQALHNDGSVAALLNQLTVMANDGFTSPRLNLR